MVLGARIALLFGEGKKGAKFGRDFAAAAQSKRCGSGVSLGETLLEAVSTEILTPERRGDRRREGRILKRGGSRQEPRKKWVILGGKKRKETPNGRILSYK